MAEVKDRLSRRRDDVKGRVLVPKDLSVSNCKFLPTNNYILPYPSFLAFSPQYSRQLQGRKTI